MMIEQMRELYRYINPRRKELINTNYCGNNIGQEYGIAPLELNEFMEEIIGILDFKQLNFEYNNYD